MSCETEQNTIDDQAKIVIESIAKTSQPDLHQDDDKAPPSSPPSPISMPRKIMTRRQTLLEENRLTQWLALSSSTTTTTTPIQTETKREKPKPRILYPRDSVQTRWNHRSPHQNRMVAGAGMINRDYTCYMIATLQALFHIPSFCNWLHSDYIEHATICEKKSKMHLIDFSRFFHII